MTGQRQHDQVKASQSSFVLCCPPVLISYVGALLRRSVFARAFRLLRYPPDHFPHLGSSVSFTLHTILPASLAPTQPFLTSLLHTWNKNIHSPDPFLIPSATTRASVDSASAFAPSHPPLHKSCINQLGLTVALNARRMALTKVAKSLEAFTSLVSFPTSAASSGGWQSSCIAMAMWRCVWVEVLFVCLFVCLGTRATQLSFLWIDRWTSQEVLCLPPCSGPPRRCARRRRTPCWGCWCPAA